MEPIHMKYNQTTMHTHNTEIETKQQEIDNYLERNEYSRAFQILLVLLKNLDQTDKINMIEYYKNKIYSNKNSNNIFPFDPYFNSK